MRTFILRSALPLALLGAAACATNDTTAHMASAQAAIQAANQVGADRTPTSALHLQYAREEYSLAEGLTRDGKTDRAQLMLQRAQADAELAMVLAREDGARAEAQQALERVRTMQQQSQQSQP